VVRSPSRAVRLVLTLFAAGCLAAATPVRAQQAADSTTPVTVTEAPAVSDNTTHAATTELRGPRLRPAEWRGAEPTFAPRNASGSTTAVAGTHTLTVTTLALVLIVILAVLLISD